MAENIQARYHISGRVQGVGFRWWTQRQAQRLGVGGTVRNLADGAVEVTVSGPPDRISQFEALLRRGPPGADVISFEVLAPPTDPQPASFEIRR